MAGPDDIFSMFFGPSPEQREQFRAQQELAVRGKINFVQGLNEDDLKTLYGIMEDIRTAENPPEIAAWFMGMAYSLLLERHDMDMEGPVT